MPRISALDLGKVKAALSHRSAILERESRNKKADGTKTIEPAKDNIWGEDVKVVNKRNLKPRLLTPAEKDDVADRYMAGASMGEIAREYRCHHTTIGSILRKKGVEIRKT